ncbi:hypothetical protein [Kocuria atrinae]|uniref:hypothetical protein n=1 Tax=Kocuria atrinae TaxID=592377 RepID=UPI001CB931FC|nr:hypothetical protein [Kocuria atrinae]
MSHRDIVNKLLDEHGLTYAQEAGIHLKDTPAPLFQLLVLANLLSTRISATIAVATLASSSTVASPRPRKCATPPGNNASTLSAGVVTAATTNALPPCSATAPPSFSTPTAGI